MAYGQGSVFQRGKIWYIQWWQDGKQMSESTRQTSQKRALEILDERRAKAKQQRKVIAKAITLIVSPKEKG